ncbi:MAG: hypothetical protein J0H01_24495 [Rhizobiales bacterium]|nr:hypothetical protein [Hyphomicrobiales bacterium]
MSSASALSRSAFEPLRLICGRNSAGLWVLQSMDGGYGSLFTSRDAALDEAMTENDGEPVDIVFAAGPVELDFRPRPDLACAPAGTARIGGRHGAGSPRPAIRDGAHAGASTIPVWFGRTDRQGVRPGFGLPGFVAASMAVIIMAAGLLAAINPL